MFPIHDYSFENYLKYVTNDRYQINYQLLKESIFINDTDYTNEMCKQYLNIQQFEFLPILTQIYYIQNQSADQIFVYINIMQEDVCKAFMKNKFTKEYVKIQVTEYIDELNDYYELLSSTVTPSTQESEEVQIGEWKNRMISYIFTELITKKWKTQPSISQIRQLILLIPDMRFLGDFALEYAQLFINSGADAINLSKNQLYTVDLHWQVQIKSVDLSNNLLQVDALKQLNLLFSSSRIRKLRLDHNKLCPDCGDVLSELLQNNDTLIELYISNNNIQHGLIRILESIEDHKNIQFLDISNNYIQDFIVDSIRTLFEKSVVFQVLRCYDQNISQVGNQMILDMGEKYRKSVNVVRNQSLKVFKTLQQRRDYERDLFYSFNTMKGGKWYIISEKWLIKWRNFIAGGVVPGQIDNYVLNLQSMPVVDYRGVKHDAWKAILDIYGGGPEICREEINI
eukprot:EST47431.1 DUSP domain-containing protein [Spironucleus salmonicida]